MGRLGGLPQVALLQCCTTVGSTAAAAACLDWLLTAVLSRLAISNVQSYSQKPSEQVLTASRIVQCSQQPGDFSSHPVAGLRLSTVQAQAWDAQNGLV